MRDVPRANSTGKSSFYHDGRPIEAGQGGSLGECSRPRRILPPPRASCWRIACSPSARPIPAAHHGHAEKEEWGGPASAQMSGGSRAARGDLPLRQRPRAGSTSPAPTHMLRILSKATKLLILAHHHVTLLAWTSPSMRLIAGSIVKLMSPEGCSCHALRTVDRLEYRYLVIVESQVDTGTHS